MVNSNSRVARVLDLAARAIGRAFRYKRALWTAWDLMTWEQRMAFRYREPELARDLSRRWTSGELALAKARARRMAEEFGDSIQ